MGATRKITISSFENLIEILETNEFSKKEMNLIVWHSLKVVPLYKTKAELIELLNDYWIKWRVSDCKPIFLGLEDLDVKN